MYFRRNYLPAIVLTLLSVRAFTQEAVERINSIYLFPSFTAGKVTFKGRPVEPASMNYHLQTQEILFMKDGSPLILPIDESIDTIHIGTRKFAPVQGRFYEVVVAGPVALLAINGCKLIDVKKYKGNEQKLVGGLDGTPRSTTTKGANYDIRPLEGMKVIPLFEFYLKRNESLVRIKGIRELTKQFPGKEKQLEQFAESEKTRFDDAGDLAKVLNYARSLK